LEVPVCLLHIVEVSSVEGDENPSVFQYLSTEENCLGDD